MSNKVLITNEQNAVKVPSGLRILIRRSCNAVLEYENFDGPAEISVTFVDNARIHETPVNFGRELSMSMTGLQMAFAYVGSCLAPPLFGLLAQNVTPRLYPWYLAVGLVVMVIMSESLHAKKAAEHR